MESGPWTILVTMTMLLMLGAVGGTAMKRVGSADCVISQFCKRDNAIQALQRQLGMTPDAATAYVTGRDIVHSCSCHQSCAYLGLCCQDAEYQNIQPELATLMRRLHTDQSSYQCQKILGRHAVVVDSCPAKADRVISKLCSSEGALEPLVTSNLTGLTYKNLYCGLCNYESSEKLEAWSWNFDCKLHFPTVNASGTTLIDKASKDNCVLNASIPQIPPGKKEIHDNIGVYLDTESFCTSPPVSSCGSRSVSNNECENGPISFIHYDGSVYRNQACLECNQPDIQDVSNATCEACEFEDCKHPSVMIHDQDLFASFGILVQPYNTQSVIKCKTVIDEADCSSILTDLVECGHGKILDYQTSECKDICPENYQLTNGECEFNGLENTCQEYVSHGSFLQQTSRMNQTIQLHGETFVMARVSDGSTCYKCDHTVAVSSENKDYSIANDGDISYKSTVVPKSLTYKVDDVTYYACLDTIVEIHTNNSSLTDLLRTEQIITYIFLTISIASLLLYMAAYLLFKRLRNIPGQIVAGNMLCLLMAYVLFAIRFIPGVEDTVGCTVVAVLVHYFFLASFIFNIVYAGFIVHSLDFVDIESNVSKWTAVRMWLIGLLTPFAVIAPALILDQTDNEYRPNYGGEFCFIDDKEGQKQIIYFVAPIGLFLTIAVCLYLTIIIKLVQLAKQTSKVRSDHTEKITVALKLLIVLGFNWIFAIVAAADKQGHVTTFIFIATCTLQGFFGFIVFVCNAASLRDLKKCMNKHPSLPNFEMSSSTGTAKSIRTKTSTDGNRKPVLRQADSNKALLRTDNDASSV